MFPHEHQGSYLAFQEHTSSNPNWRIIYLSFLHSQSGSHGAATSHPEWETGPVWGPQLGVGRGIWRVQPQLSISPSPNCTGPQRAHQRSPCLPTTYRVSSFFTFTPWAAEEPISLAVSPLSCYYSSSKYTFPSLISQGQFPTGNKEKNRKWKQTGVGYKLMKSSTETM